MSRTEVARTGGAARCGIMDAVTTQTLPDTDTRGQGTDRSNDDDPKVFHYVRKEKITESAVMGTHVVALCGEVFPVTRSPKPGSPVCPECKRIFQGLPPGKKS